MELIFNDLSLHGQFDDITAFRNAVGHVMKMRTLAQRFGCDLYCHRNVANAQVTSSIRMVQAAQVLDMSARQALMRWITQHGPFWEDTQQHGPDDYLACGEEVVSERGIGEAAYGCFHGLDRRLVSLSPSSWLFSPIPVTWHRDDNVTTANVENYWEADKLEETLKAAPVPMRSWKDLEETASTRYPVLTFSQDTFSPLLPRPFSIGAANQILQILNVLHERKTSFDGLGRLTDEGHALERKHFAGDTAWFSDSSDTEKAEFKRELTFRHPLHGGEYLFCTWHGKVRSGFLRVHFSWPITADTPLCVVYVGPKITRR